MRWYVVHAYSNFEHRVQESLKERIRRAGLEAKFGEILVPTEEVVEMKSGQKALSERRLQQAAERMQEHGIERKRDALALRGMQGDDRLAVAVMAGLDAGEEERRVAERRDRCRRRRSSPRNPARGARGSRSSQPGGRGRRDRG